MWERESNNTTLDLVDRWIHNVPEALLRICKYHSLTSICLVLFLFTAEAASYFFLPFPDIDAQNLLKFCVAVFWCWLLCWITDNLFDYKVSHRIIPTQALSLCICIWRTLCFILQQFLVKHRSQNGENSVYPDSPCFSFQKSKNTHNDAWKRHKMYIKTFINLQKRINASLCGC